MSTPQQKQVLRQHRREHGLCLFCGAVSIHGETRCQACKTKDKANAAIRRARNELNGLCKNSGCNRPVTPPHKYCDQCNARSARNDSKRWHDRTAAGMCGDCGLCKAIDGLTRCKPCNDKLKQAAKLMCDNRAAEGKCRACGLYIIEAGYKQCRSCIDKGRARHSKLKIEIMNAYGGPVCIGCGESEICVLQMDHIAGGGTQHTKEIGGRGRLYAWLKANNFPVGFRVLCANCNIRAARKQPFPGDKYNR